MVCKKTASVGMQKDSADSKQRLKKRNYQTKIKNFFVKLKRL